MHIMSAKIKQLIDADQLGRSIKTRRKALGYTQLELAGVVDLHHSQIVRIEQGRIATLNKSVRKICTYLDIDLKIIEDPEPSSLIARVERLVRDAPESTALLLSTVENLELMLFSKS
ncbi:helix-turn-helix domain-containing protein [Pseudomonas cedrina]|uniref:helix-turn-helix domain-containing protein n=1 Tax=Pseudomonas cedrina TaxID=651740 RepID=UPI002789DECD|nr:helix-turn-helix transcriptional regulator [Pseudomonas cedrina]MDQ0652382.1 transcriptional regulator with XRE-family HTH domain [Pseudomonas cedrina]